MTPPPTGAGRERRRHLLFLGHPALWPAWPFLPVVRRRPGREEECGLLYDAKRARGLYGLSATVFRANLFLLPATVEEFLALPRETYDTPEEVYDAGWRID
jgi:hypothetical protein